MIVTDEFFLGMEPFPAERTDCSCRGRFAKVYTKPKYRAWKTEAVEALNTLAEGKDLSAVRESPVTIWVEAIRARPKSTKLAAPLGDNDNIEKALWDAMSQAGHWWDDDRQIVENHTVKRWADEGETPGYRVKLEYHANHKFSKG